MGAIPIQTHAVNLDAAVFGFSGGSAQCESVSVKLARCCMRTCDLHNSFVFAGEEVQDLVQRVLGTWSEPEEASPRNRRWKLGLH